MMYPYRVPRSWSETSGQSPLSCLSFQNVTKTYEGAVRALDEVTLDLEPGLLTVLLGASGSGKTTLLKTAIGLVEPDSGTVRIGSLAMAGRTKSAARRRLAMIHQDFGLVTRLSVARNVMAGVCTETSLWRLLLQAYPKDVQLRAAEALFSVGLTASQFNRKARDLSGGQMQRVGIARALMRYPQILLADEPIASLDPAASDNVMQILRRLCDERGIGVVCSLHQISFARRYADRIVAMRHGQVIFDGPPSAFSGERLEHVFGQEATATSTPRLAHPVPAAGKYMT
ncbi:phosphonate ABC transporter ATP-binding protein [Henriciella sp.]|uniref:phosphonate ABC transporter ATP-binding protein n=1 Tax=Henriciella sp. TaxID=1968823 RepID=UPI0026265C57|nr:phosphonate ABC transporter ATP-binding protein [Henriciella sp.]